MIVLLGCSGYVGGAFERALQQRGETFVGLSREQLDYTRFEPLVEFLTENHTTFLINAAGYTGSPNVDACEVAKADTLQGNALFPLTVSHACRAAGVPWGHVSSGCIYSGAKIWNGRAATVAPDLLQQEAKDVWTRQPDLIRGFTEADGPNFSFRSTPCSFYSGTKALAEESLADDHHMYTWRLRIPFDQVDHRRNYLTKLLRYPKIYENVNSLSHLGDFVHACLEMWDRHVPYGIYNMTNPGHVTTRQVVQMLRETIAPDREFDFWADDEEFYRVVAKTPRSNCVLDVSKLLSSGIEMRPVEQALADSLENWKWESNVADYQDNSDQTSKSGVTIL